ncbi:MAG: hypothetical protein HKO91_11720, partial [Desulfobacterales bacterium]|nr:hypothetical protein [Desulfobacterales bacterium]
MYKHFILICSAVFFICLSGLFSGCDSRSELPRKPKIVYKKITAQPKGNPGAAKTAPGKSTPAKVKQPDLGLKPKADISRTRAVKISKRPSAPSKKQQKITLKPKSDISKITIAEKRKKPVDSSIDSNKVAVKKDALVAKPDTPKVKDGMPDKKATTATKGTEGIIASVSMPDSTVGRYSIRGRIDPFEPLFKDKPVLKAKRAKRIPRTPLEKISIGQLKLVAIIRTSNGNKALVEESSGKGYVIKKGTYIGLNSGKIIKIAKDNIIIEEEIQDIQGNLE